MVGSIRYGQYRSDPDVIEEDLAYFQEHQHFAEEDAATKLQAHWRGCMVRKQAAEAMEDEIAELERLNPLGQAAEDANERADRYRAGLSLAGNAAEPRPDTYYANRLEEAEARADAAVRAAAQAEHQQQVLQQQILLLEQQKVLAQEEATVATAHDATAVSEAAGATWWLRHTEDAEEQVHPPPLPVDLMLQLAATAEAGVDLGSRGEADDDDNRAAAQRIQAVYRGHIVRTRLASSRHELAEAKAAAMEAEATAVQARARAKEVLGRQQLQQLHESSDQSSNKHPPETLGVAEDFLAATEVVAACRGDVARTSNEQPRLPSPYSFVEEDAATKLQAHWRGCMVRKQAAEAMEDEIADLERLYQLGQAAEDANERADRYRAGLSLAGNARGNAVANIKLAQAAVARTHERSRLPSATVGVPTPRQLSPSKIPRLSPDVTSRSPGRYVASRVSETRSVTPSRLPIRRAPRSPGGAQAIRARLAAAGHESFGSGRKGNKHPPPPTRAMEQQTHKQRSTSYQVAAGSSATSQQLPTARERAKARRLAKPQRKARANGQHPTVSAAKDESRQQRKQVQGAEAGETAPLLNSPLGQAIVGQPAASNAASSDDLYEDVDEPPPLISLPWEVSQEQVPAQHDHYDHYDHYQRRQQNQEAEECEHKAMLLVGSGISDSSEDNRLQRDDSILPVALEEQYAKLTHKEKQLSVESGDESPRRPAPTHRALRYPGLSAGLRAYGHARPNPVSALQQSCDEFEVLVSDALETLCTSLPGMGVWAEIDAGGATTLAPPGEAGKRVAWEALLLELHDDGSAELAAHWLRRGSEKAGTLSAKKARLLVTDALDWLRATVMRYLKRAVSAPFESFLARAERMIQVRDVDLCQLLDGCTALCVLLLLPAVYLVTLIGG